MKFQLDENESADLTAEALLRIQKEWVHEQQEEIDRLRLALDRLTEAREILRGSLGTLAQQRIVDVIIEVAADISKQHRDLATLQSELKSMENDVGVPAPSVWEAPPIPDVPLELEGLARRQAK